MRVFLFQPRFHDAIRAGVKRSTIRERARCKPGDALSLRGWTGLPYRSKQEVLLEAICKAVKQVTISKYDIFVNTWILPTFELRNELALQEGFCDYHDMMDWFKANREIPFTGEMTEW